MAAAELTVRRLHLAGAGRAMGPRVEDALRTAAQPTALRHRHVLVRRLRVRAAPGASAQSLALLFERAWQRLADAAREIDAAGESDEAVWAASETAARVALIARWARGTQAEAWFWRRIAAAAGAGPWPVRAATLMLAPPGSASAVIELEALSARAVRVRAGLAEVVRAGAVRAFADGVEPAQAGALLACCAWPDFASWAWADAIDGRPLLRTSAGANTSLATLVVALQRRAAGEAVVWPDVPESDAPAVARLGGVPEHATGEAAPARPAVDRPKTTAGLAFAEAILAPVTAAAVSHAIDSPWSGLWLLLPLLLREGMADADEPLRALSGVLQAACARFAVPDDDPVRHAIAALELPPPVDGTAWLRRARHAAVRDARLPLRRIAHRPGAVWVSAERIDVEFPAAAADVRIRRAGFDLDPGFVPWLGRIVHVHYT